MASGYGLNGGPSRCFPFWQETLACYVVNAKEDDPNSKRKCIGVLEDYHECLHHKKEYARALAMQKAMERRAAGTTPRDDVKMGEIRNLGLLEKDRNKTKRQAHSPTSVDEKAQW